MQLMGGVFILLVVVFIISCGVVNQAGFYECKSCQNDNVYYPITRYTTMCPCGGH